MTLDAGGTSFRFFAIRSGRSVTEPLVLPTEGHSLDRCLSQLRSGFEVIRSRCPEPPVAISFAFPGPADYPAGVIGDLPNLPAFRGGVALGPMLRETFGLPVFINNDGDLFTYGEAMAGFLPQVNAELEKAGGAKRYCNLLGVTLGTGLGGGLVRDGQLFAGDNSGSAELWLMRNKLEPATNAEEGACIRAVRRAYAAEAGIPLDAAPTPKGIADIANGTAPGPADAARHAFQRLGEVLGDVLANALTIVDGLAVIGGGLSAAAPLFLPAVMKELNGTYAAGPGSTRRRLVQRAYNLEDPAQSAEFLSHKPVHVAVPGTGRTVLYDPVPRVGIGISRLGTSQAISLGACAFALAQLDRHP